MASDKSKPSGKVQASEGDRSLKNMFGKGNLLSKVFSKEKIEACQNLIETAKDSFFDVSLPDVAAMNALFKTADEIPGNYQVFYRTLLVHAANIKGQAQLFGFPLIIQLSGHLITYCDAADARKAITSKDMRIIRKIVEAISVAFKSKITDGGGKTGKELLLVIEQVLK